MRPDDGYAGPDRTLPDDEIAITADDRRVPNLDARNIGDRVELPRLQPPDLIPSSRARFRSTLCSLQDPRTYRRSVDDSAVGCVHVLESDSIDFAICSTQLQPCRMSTALNSAVQSVSAE